MAATPVADQLRQLGDARALVLGDPVYWPQVLHGILPIVSGPIVELRRWGADFLAETFSTPVVDINEKQSLAVTCLDTMVRLMDEKEAGILKSVVQCSASVYPLVFRYMCNNRDDQATWDKMDMIKSKILSLWDSGPVGVRLGCIKFVQRVILVQSRGVTDPRLADRSEISLTMVPTNHPVLSLPALDAEAQGLLDRLLSILHEDPSDPALITATLNNLSVIVKTRAPLAHKILSAVMNFNPLAIIAKANTVKNRLMMQCMEKTVRVLLMNIARANQNGPYTAKISQHITRLSQAKAEVLEELSRKRPAPTQTQPEAEAIKRMKVENAQAQAVITPTATPPPPPPVAVITGPMTYGQLYTLSTDVAMTSFDGQQLPIDLVLQIIVGSINSLSQQTLQAAIAAVNSRYTALMAYVPPASAPIPQDGQVSQAAQPGAEEMQGEQVEQRDIEKKEEDEEEEEEERELQLGKFRLPPPTSLAPEEMHDIAIQAIDRMFSVVDQFDKTSLISRKSKLGANRLAASNWDREGWIAVLTRLATRGMGDTAPDTVKKEEVKGGDEENGEIAQMQVPTALSTAIREKLYNFVIADFRGRMDVAVSWLNEEWYNDQVMSRAGVNREPQYRKWMMKVMDGIFPFLESKDRLFMRLLSEIPEVTVELMQKVKMLCLDPDRAMLGIQMLHYLAMLRPPVRDMCMDVLEDLYQNHAEVRVQAQKLLQKWRPEALAAIDNAQSNTQNANGMTATLVQRNSATTATIN